MSFTLIIRKKFYKMNEIFYNILYQLMENYAMKRFLELLKDRANEFFNDKTSLPAPLEDGKTIQIIELALRKKQGVHVIFQNKSFTGDIGKYDQELPSSGSMRCFFFYVLCTNCLAGSILFIEVDQAFFKSTDHITWFNWS